MIVFILSLSIIMLAVAFIILIFRFYLGPTIIDRALVLEVMGIGFISILAIDYIQSKNQFNIEIALIVSLIPFLGSIALSRIVTWKDK